MHVLLVTHYYAPETGAPQRRWGALVPRIMAAGHTVTVLAPSPHYPEGRAEDLSPDLRPGARATGEWGEQVVRLRFREHGPGLKSRTADQLVTALDATVQGWHELRGSRRPDVVVATVPGIPSIFAGAALAGVHRAPLVIEMRDAWPDLVAASGMFGPTGRRGWQGWVVRRVHAAITRGQRRAAGVVTTTASFAEVLRERGVRRVDVIRNGAPVDEVPALGPRQGDGPLRVVYAGTVGRSQGLHTAVRAATELTRRGVPVELRILGSGAELDHLRREVTISGAPVELPGRVPRAEVYEHYRWADTILVSLRGWEPFRWTVPSKLYEVLATGRHVTGVLAGEAAEIVTTSGAGHVSPPDDEHALADLWQHLAENRHELAVGDGGRAWASTHAGFDQLAEDYLRLLEEVVRR